MTAKDFLNKKFGWSAVPNQKIVIKMMEAYRDHCRDEWIRHINEQRLEWLESGLDAEHKVVLSDSYVECIEILKGE